ncbi:AAA family ATPase [Streptacidiphilus sp. EB103A]|uniref:AAA family ATPase n=1 Tax=Streptacidiphilus sp. EB103A TaxID=3156275 RepID=UPI003511BA3B
MDQNGRAGVAYLLVGLTGSGKTTYARRRLEQSGLVRLSVDEIVVRDHGRYGVDYPEASYFEREAGAVAEVRQLLAELVGQGRDVVLDHGLWLRRDRDEWKKLVEEVGGSWRLLYFPVPREELLRRLAERNLRQDANSLAVSEAALDDFYRRFEVPHDEGEETVDPVGD